MSGEEPFVTWSNEWKKQKLIDLWKIWENCQGCGLCETRKNIVYGSGPVNADVLIIGEAPGEQEDLKGIPFIGSSGEILREFLASVGIESYFLTNTVMCRPPENRAPNSSEKKACAARLYREIYVIDPLVIVAAGKESFQLLAGGRANALTGQRGETFPCEIPGVKFNITYDVMPIYHPAYVMRFDKRYTSGVKKGQWKPGGPAEEVYRNLHTLKLTLDNLKRHYSVVLEKHGV